MTRTLRLVTAEQIERTFGSREFIALTRKPELVSPRRFEPTVKRDGDVVI